MILVRAHGRFEAIKWSLGLTAAVVLFAATAATAVRADDVPGIGDWEHYRFSLDETPITVVFVHESGRRDFPVLTIPRSYIYFENGARPTTEGPLGDHIETDGLGVALADPDGEAWSTAVETYSVQHQLSRDSAAKQMRSRSYTVRLSPNTNPRFADAAASSAARNRTLTRIASDGLKEYVGRSSSNTYYVGDSGDEFITTRCFNPTDPEFFCEYTFLITSGIVGRADFSDFRLNGGRDYANRRVRLTRQAICRFFEDC